MKNLMTILCLLCFAGCAYAEIYEVPGSRVETTSEVQVTQDGTKQVSETKVKRKRLYEIILFHDSLFYLLHNFINVF